MVVGALDDMTRTEGVKRIWGRRHGRRPDGRVPRGLRRGRGGRGRGAPRRRPAIGASVGPGTTAGAGLDPLIPTSGVLVLGTVWSAHCQASERPRRTSPPKWRGGAQGTNDPQARACAGCSAHALAPVARARAGRARGRQEVPPAHPLLRRRLGPRPADAQVGALGRGRRGAVGQPRHPARDGRVPRVLAPGELPRRGVVAHERGEPSVAGGEARRPGGGRVPGEGGLARVDARLPGVPCALRARGPRRRHQRDGRLDGPPERERDVPGARGRTRGEGGRRGQAGRRRAEEHGDTPVVGAAARQRERRDGPRENHRPLRGHRRPRGPVPDRRRAPRRRQPRRALRRRAQVPRALRHQAEA